MRPSFPLVLALLATSAAPGAEKPIPQDLARADATAREALAWSRKTLPLAYDQVGKRNPRWDGLASYVLDIAARVDSGDLDSPTSEGNIHRATKQAVEAGCDDPLILFLYAKTTPPANFPGMDEYLRRLRVASEGMLQSRYPVVRRAYASELYVDIDAQRENITPEERKQFDPRLDAVMDLMPRSLAEDPSSPFLDFAWYDLSKAIIAVRAGLNGGDDKAAFDRVDAKLAGVKGAEAIRLTVGGNFFMNWGWKGRGTAFADAVTDDQFRSFHARLAEARRSLERAWELKPVGYTIPNNMLTIEIGIGDGDRDRAAMEKWFERAMEVNAYNTQACVAKLQWLEPKWHGDANGDEMIAFGRACAATKNWRTGIILLGAEAHFRKRSLVDPAEWGAYLKRPEVWADFATAYPEYLKHRPYNHAERSRYAMACVSSEHYREAHEQFQILGDNLTEWRSHPQYPLESMKESREEVARFVKDQKK